MESPNTRVDDRSGERNPIRSHSVHGRIEALIEDRPTRPSSGPLVASRTASERIAGKAFNHGVKKGTCKVVNSFGLAHWGAREAARLLTRGQSKER
jgi:hypothetical protein